MTIINNIDCGAHPTWGLSQSTRKGTVWASEVQSAVIEGGQSIIWPRAGAIRKRTETIWVSVNPPDPTKVLALVRQLQELSSNPNLQPVYIQWASGAGNIVVDPEDGWYTLENATPDEDIATDGIVPVTITVSYIAPGLASRALAVSYFGGPAVIGWGGPAINWLSFPLNATGIPNLTSRFGGEGYVPTAYALPMSAITPQAFNPSGTISDNFKGRVSVWDTVNTGANPIPTSAGVFVNPNWVEVFHPDHQFVGDCVITNGIILLLINIGNGGGVPIYGWNISTNLWVSNGGLLIIDNAGSGCPVRSFVIGRISLRECSIKLITSSTTPAWQESILRIISGADYIRWQIKPTSQTNLRSDFIGYFPNFAPKISYTDSNLRDNILDQGLFPITPNVASANGFGYSATFTPTAGQPFVAGWLYLDNTGQQNQGNVESIALTIGDSQVLPVINQNRFYGFFLVPFPLVANLQAEAESGTLGTGWSSVADVNASAGNTAKAASGTTINNADIFGTSWVPPTGAYDVWFRVKVTSNAGSAAEMTLGLRDDIAANFLANSATTLRANQFTTSYTWIKTNTLTPLLLNSGHAIRFFANVSATLGTDWFIDEAALVPVDLGPSFNSLAGPRNIWSEFAFDRTTKVIVVS